MGVHVVEQHSAFAFDTGGGIGEIPQPTSVVGTGPGYLLPRRLTHRGATEEHRQLIARLLDVFTMAGGSHAITSGVGAGRPLPVETAWP